MTTNSLMLEFDFEGNAVRTLERDGNPWFVLADVCRVLAIGNPRMAADRLDDDEKCKVDMGVSNPDGAKINDLGVGAGNNEAWIINESGLYSIVLTSRKPAAKRFKKWVTGTVLPAIRKDGAYIAGEEKVATGEMTEDELLLRAMTILQDKATRLAAERDAAVSRVAKLEPAAGAFDNFLSTDGKLTLRDAAKQLGLGPKDFVSRLIAGGYLFRSSGDLHVKAAYAPAGRGWFETRARSGFGWNSIQVFVTNKGLAAFAKKMMIKVEA